MMDAVETVVIGGGQAGLAMSYCLRQHGCEHLVLERARVAERWHSERWDSLCFQFPNWSIELPGLAYSAPDAHGFAHKTDVARFIAGYGVWAQAPVRTGVDVTSLRRLQSGVGFDLETSQGRLQARNVIVATGPYQRPCPPSGECDLPSDVVQLHASAYRNPAALPAGAVVVVGSGASGCQIADELVEAGRHVFLSVGRHRRLPRSYRGRDVFWWRRELGELDRLVSSLPPRHRSAPPLVTGAHGGYELDLRQSARRGLQLLGHFRGAADGSMAFAQDVESSLRDGDQAYREFLAAVDTHVTQAGLDAPGAADTGVLPMPRGPTELLVPRASLNIAADRIGSVIWATGYALDFRWINVPVFDATGAPLHQRGVTSVAGLYFLGLRWLNKLKSSFLCGVGEDAAYIASCIAPLR
jgi:putative flavoprotein involved in K+ transport